MTEKILQWKRHYLIPYIRGQQKLDFKEVFLIQVDFLFSTKEAWNHPMSKAVFENLG